MEHAVENGAGGGEAAGLPEGVAVPGTVGEPPAPLSKLRIEGNGLTFERQITDPVVLKVMKLVLGGGEEPEPAKARQIGAGSTQTGQSAGGREESLSEFYRRIQPDKIAEKLVAVGHYLNERGQTSFNIEDVRSAFRTVRENQPGNLARDLRSAVALGWLDEERGTPGQFFVTLSGEQALEAGFSSDARPRARRKGRKSSARTGNGSGAQEGTDE